MINRKGTVKPTAEEKRLSAEFGQIFTPPHIVDKILDLLDPEDWTNPNVKFVEPACGDGAFIRGLIERLMVGLADFEPDPERRYVYIIENNIHAIDIRQENIDACIQRFSLAGLKHNFVCGNGLSHRFPFYPN